MVYWKAQGVPVRIIRNLLWGKNPMAEQNLLTEENAMEVTESTEQESVQALSVEAASRWQWKSQNRRQRTQQR